MIIYTYLKKDHEKVGQLFQEIIENNSSLKREKLFDELREELLLHTDAEHATFYKALKKHEDTKELIKHAEKEHHEVKDYLNQLSETSSKNVPWLVLLGELKHAVEHHVKEEETTIFSKAKKVLDKDIETDLVKQIEDFKENQKTSSENGNS